MPSRLSLLFAMVVIGISSLNSRGDELSGFSTSLFNGKDLQGWHSMTCEAAVENELLVIQAGNGLLRTDHRYRDFVLELEWKALQAEAYDSGIYFRCEPPEEGQSFPRRYQINLKQGDEGNLIGFPQARSAGLTIPGAWNRFRLTVIGTSAALEINGKPAWKTEGIEALDGYLGIQVEVPLGGKFQFRNLQVTELGYRALFNGADLNGWEGAGQEAAACWKVDAGLLVCTGQKGPWLRSQQQFGDFDLRLEYKIRPGGNSGVYVRVPEDGNHHGPGSGVEIQILDDASERYRELKPYQYTGSVYAIAPATQHVGRPPETWNSLEIECRGQAYRVTHNGVVIIDVEEIQFPELKERRLDGFFGLQNHSEEVWFRNLRVFEFKSTSTK